MTFHRMVRRGGALFELEKKSGVEREVTDVGSVDGEAVTITNFEADGEGVTGLEEAGGDVDFLEVAVGTSLVERKVIGAGRVYEVVGWDDVGVVSGCALHLPRESTTMVGRIVGDVKRGYLLPVDGDDDLGGIGVEVGLGIAVWEGAGISSSLSAHEVAFGHVVRAILTVETFGGGFEEKRCAFESLGLDVFGYYDSVFEITAAEAVDLIATHSEGIAFGPDGLAEVEGCEGLGLLAWGIGGCSTSINMKEDEVAVEYIAAVVT